MPSNVFVVLRGSLRSVLRVGPVVPGLNVPHQVWPSEPGTASLPVPTSVTVPQLMSPPKIDVGGAATADGAAINATRTPNNSASFRKVSPSPGVCSPARGAAARA